MKETEFEQIINNLEKKEISFKRHRDFIKAMEEGQYSIIEDSIIQRIIDEIIKSPDVFVYVVPENQIFYRARIIDDDTLDKSNGFEFEENGDLNGYNEQNSREPSIFLSVENRNNLAGVSYLYLADTEYIACSEVKPFLHSMISLSTFTNIKQLRIIDFRTDHVVKELQSKFENEDISVSHLLTLIMLDYIKPHKGKNDYKVCQYIADSFRKAGFDGIKYGSQWSHEGACYTIFNSDKSYIKYNRSEIVELINHTNTFVKYNQPANLLKNPINDPTIDFKDLSERRKAEINSHIKSKQKKKNQ